MGTIFKTVITFGVIILITALGISITATNVEITDVNDYMEEIATVIRAGNYSEEIIRQCITEAGENGYILEVEVYENEQAYGNRYARVRLNYKYQFPILNTFSWKKKERII